MSNISWFVVLSGLFGGLGLFLMGMKMMSEGLQKTAGKGLRTIFQRSLLMKCPRFLM